MRQPVAANRIAQSRDHRVLADQLGKGLRPVFAREHAIGGATVRLRRLAEVEGVGHCDLSRTARDAM